jgi:hypothetical protein
MQDCFRQHPEIYGAEIADEEDAEPTFDAEAPLTKEGVETSAPAVNKSEQAEAVAEPAKPVEPAAATSPVVDPVQAIIEEPREDSAVSETSVPNNAHDATEANKGKEQ